MEGVKIQANQCVVGDVFADRYRFTIPRYQRPYAWTMDEAGELLSDLLDAIGGATGLSVEPYFLGSVVLVKNEDQADAEVIDGQQRLTTLTVLLGVAREFVSPKFADALDNRIFQKGDPITGIIDQPRLRIRQQDQDFFERHIQQRPGLPGLDKIDVGSLPDSQRNLVENARLFRGELGKLGLAQCERLVQYIIQHTYVVIVATQNLESAYRIFSVLNERGLDLSLTDILKAEIIGRIPAEEQDEYTRKWESEEDSLGRDEFIRLFSHIRMVYAKSKARGSILQAIRSSVLDRHPDRREFIDQVLVPLSDAYEMVIRADYPAATGAAEVNGLLGWLKRLDNFDWIPLAISYLVRPDVTPTTLRAFLADVERLAASMFIRRVDVTRRVERYGQVLEAIEAEADLSAAVSPLQLTPDEKAATRQQLGGELYPIARIRLYVLLRLDSVLSGAGASYEYLIISVEHVLPQNPPAKSAWTTWFTDAQRTYWVHRLANLVLLTRKKNAQAGNFNFDNKKRRYFATDSGVSPFAITTMVLGARDWTPAILEARQEQLVDTLTTLWRLS